jgi:hypothetical protein
LINPTVARNSRSRGPEEVIAALKRRPSNIITAVDTSLSLGWPSCLQKDE